MTKRKRHIKGYVIHPRHWPRIFERWKAGETIKQIAPTYRCSYVTIYRICAKQLQAEGRAS